MLLILNNWALVSTCRNLVQRIFLVLKLENLLENFDILKSFEEKIEYIILQNNLKVLKTMIK